MSLTNARVMRVARLLGEYFATRDAVAAKERDIQEFDARLNAAEKDRNRLNQRACQIAAELKGGFERARAVEWRHGGVNYAVGYDASNGLLSLTPIKGYSALASDGPLRFTPDEISEAAMHAAAETFAAAPDDDDDLDSVADAMDDDGEEWHGDDVINLPGGDMVAIGRQAVIQNGVAVIDQEEID